MPRRDELEAIYREELTRWQEAILAYDRARADYDRARRNFENARDDLIQQGWQEHPAFGSDP